MPTSEQINRAIETLRAAEVHSDLVDALDGWNAMRLRFAAGKVRSGVELQELFLGITPITSTAARFS